MLGGTGLRSLRLLKLLLLAAGKQGMAEAVGRVLAGRHQAVVHPARLGALVPRVCRNDLAGDTTVGANDRAAWSGKGIGMLGRAEGAHLCEHSTNQLGRGGGRT